MAPLSPHDDDSSDGVNVAANVFAKYGDFIRAVIRCRVANAADADDLFQDFFLSLVYRPIPPHVKNIKGYLYRAITNDILDAARRVKRYQGRIRIYAKSTNNFINKRTPENAIVEAEEIDRMFGLIEKRLRKSESLAVTLRYKEQHSIGEVAEKMGVDKQSVGRYVCVGLGKIRQFFAVKRGDDNDCSPL